MKKLVLGTCSAPIVEDVIEGFDEANATCALRVREVKENVCTDIRGYPTMLVRVK